MSGFDVVAALKSDPNLKSLPILVLTSNTASTYINDAFQKGVNAVINKPLTLDEHRSVFIDTLLFWKNIASLSKNRAL